MVTDTYAASWTMKQPMRVQAEGACCTLWLALRIVAIARVQMFMLHKVFDKDDLNVFGVLLLTLVVWAREDCRSGQHFNFYKALVLLSQLEACHCRNNLRCQYTLNRTHRPKDEADIQRTTVTSWFPNYLHSLSTNFVSRKVLKQKASCLRGFS